MFLFLLFPLLVTSCASLGTKRNYTVTSMSILNDSSSPVTSFQIYIPKRDRTLTISQIPAGAESSYGFPVRDYQGNPIHLRWTHQGRQYEKKGLVLNAPSDLPEVMPLNARFIIRNGRKVSGSLESAQLLLQRVEAMRGRP